MKNFMTVFLKQILVILSLLVWITSPVLLSGCGEGGTETGNPTGEGFTPEDEGEGGDDEDSGEEPISAEGLETSAGQILDAICMKLDTCFAGLTLADCEIGVLPVNNVDDDLGLSDPFDSYQAIIDAEMAGTLVPNDLATWQCLNSIDALSCSSLPVQNAYDPDEPDNFDNVDRMVPNGTNSCEGVF